MTRLLMMDGSTEQAVECIAKGAIASYFVRPDGVLIPASNVDRVLPEGGQIDEQLHNLDPQ